MQVVININENTYNSIREGFYEENVGKMAIAIIDGVVLPKGHGDLKDADALLYKHGDDILNWSMAYGVSNESIRNAPIVIEADKENTE